MKTLLLTTSFSSSVAARWGQWRAVLLLSALLCLIGGRAARAQENPVAGVSQVQGLTYRVWGSNFASRPSRLRLVSEDGRVLYEQYSAAITFGKWLNLSDLPDGHYAFLLRIGREEHRFDVQLRTTEQRLAEVSKDQVPAAPHLLSAGLPGRAAR